MPAHPGEKLLAGELIACYALSYIAEIYRNRDAIGADPLGAVPRPQVFLPIFGAFSALGLVALFGPGPARIAAGVGGLVTLVIVLKSAGILFQTSTTGAVTPVAPFAPPQQSQGVALV